MKTSLPLRIMVLASFDVDPMPPVLASKVIDQCEAANIPMMVCVDEAEDQTLLSQMSSLSSVNLANVHKIRDTDALKKRDGFVRPVLLRADYGRLEKVFMPLHPLGNSREAVRQIASSEYYKEYETLLKKIDKKAIPFHTIDENVSRLQELFGDWKDAAGARSEGMAKRLYDILARKKPHGLVLCCMNYPMARMMASFLQDMIDQSPIGGVNASVEFAYVHSHYADEMAADAVPESDKLSAKNVPESYRPLDISDVAFSEDPSTGVFHSTEWDSHMQSLITLLSRRSIVIPEWGDAKAETLGLDPKNVLKREDGSAVIEADWNAIKGMKKELGIALTRIKCDAFVNQKRFLESQKNFTVIAEPAGTLLVIYPDRAANKTILEKTATQWATFRSSDEVSSVLGDAAAKPVFDYSRVLG